MRNWHLQAGERTEKLTIQTITTGRGASGGVTETPGTFATVWAQKVQGRGAEREGGGQIVARQTVTFRILYLQGLTAKDHQILYNGQVYDIVTAPRELGFRKVLEIECKLRDNQ